MAVRPGYLGLMLKEVLEGRGELTSISPTDLVFDIHHMAVTLEEHLQRWGESNESEEAHASQKLLPIIKLLKEATADKYAVVSEN